MSDEYILTRFNRLYNPPNWYYNPNHLTNRIYYIIGGNAMYRDSVRLKPGNIYVFRASPDFMVSQSPEDPVDHIYFDFITSEQLLDEEYLEIETEKYPKLKFLTELMKESFEPGVYGMGKSNISPEAGDAFFTLLIDSLKGFFAKGKLYSELTANALRIIHESNPQDISVAYVASEMKMNVNHIIRTFKKETGITPHKYINLMKANLATEFVRQGISLKETAEKLGFGSVSSFSVFFKTTTGRNISSFR